MAQEKSDALLLHDRSLTHKVASGSEAGEIVDQQLVQLGAQLVTQLNVLLRIVKSHGSTNTALDRPVASIQQLVRTLGNDQPVALRLREGFVFLGERHVKTSTQQLPIFSAFFDSLASLGVGGIVLRPGVTPAELRRFAELFVATEPDDTAIGPLTAQLATEKIETITLEAPMRSPREAMPQESVQRGAAGGAQRDLHAHTRERARNGYSRAAAALSLVNQNARSGGALHFRQAKRAIQNIVDLLLKDPATVLSLTTLHAHDEYTQNHSVNVAVLAMALANRAGFPKIELADIGLAALFHDLGKCAIPLEVLNKPGELEPSEWELMKTHPSEGVLALLRMRGLGNVPMRMAAASFEHHLNFNASGYPAVGARWKQTLSSRIVSIADCYDAMTSARVYRREPLAPPAVLAYMLGRSGTLFDPPLLRHFVTSLGIIPIGTMLLLDTGELAVVLRPAVEKEHAQRPTVRLIADASGTPLDPALECDLRETNAEGAYLRSIVKLVDNTKHRLDTSRYLAR